MAKGMKAIKDRMSSIKSTKKVTSAMQLVSMAKLQKYQRQIISIKSYKELVEQHMQHILVAAKNKQTEIDVAYFRQPKETRKIAYIVFTSDVGLCGGYNVNVLRTLREEVKAQPDVEHLFYFVGKNGAEKAAFYNLSATFALIGRNETLSYEELTDEIVMPLMDMYACEEIDAIKIMYTEYKNPLIQNPILTQMLPANFEATNQETAESGEPVITADTLFEPNPNTVLTYLAPKMISTMVYIYLLESLTSEAASRRMAMESANTNADQMLDTLSILYNRERQAAITQEMSEIIGGSESLN
ncbi:MAG: ATP synthase F1 subunit gamma [Culicoidibacterales bacterium]